jgi:GH15 family glucan-1,4-alpha-glucosidase
MTAAHLNGIPLYPPIGDYAIVGDCHTAALVSREGSVDWYCPERFDRPAIFCRLLDWDKGGYFRVSPKSPRAARRQYLGETNVLQTIFDDDRGQLRLTDFMPIERRTDGRGKDVETRHNLVRLIESTDGDCDVEITLEPRFEYGGSLGEMRIIPGRGVIASHRGDYLTLRCADVPLERDTPGRVQGSLALRAGERRWLVLSTNHSERDAFAALEPRDEDTAFARTLDYWQRWADLCTYTGPYRAEVIRGALVLKLLTHEPTGSIVAAPTTSLPEELGGMRNWDYRFSWLRDSGLTLSSLISLGYHAEAADYFEWLVEVCASDPRIAPRVMYRVDGSVDLTERTLRHLEGYAGSAPVRIGNDAVTQRQHDVYGAILNAAYVHRISSNTDPSIHDTHEGEAPSDALWGLLAGFVEQAAQRWTEPGSGIWEMRGPPRHFVHGKVMCWSALDCGIRLARQHRLPAPLANWEAARDSMAEAIIAGGYDDRRGAFVQSFGTSNLDASLLTIPLVGFLPTTDPRVRSTMERIQSELTHNKLVYRYRSDDWLQGTEGAFVLCTFWLVNNLTMSNRLDEARALFEHVISFANDVGLLSEEIEPRTGALLGNFPQAFSHLGLINAAVLLHETEQSARVNPP